MIETTYNADYAGGWADHYGSLTGSRYRGEASYVASRARFMERQLPDELPFEITTNGGADLIVEGSRVALQGKGWINVRRIRIGDSAQDPEWIDDETWMITVGLSSGENALELEALDYRGRSVGVDSIKITNSGGSSSPSSANIAISEFLYHPRDPDDTEVAAGFTDSEVFEFLELLNIGEVPVDLSGSKFTRGIGFAFPDGASIGPDQRLVIASSAAGFEQRFGLAGGG